MPTKLESLRGRRKLTRAPKGRNITDEPGTVRISVILLDVETRQHQKGNITRHFHLSNVRVSEVARSLEERLFNGGASNALPHVTL